MGGGREGEKERERTRDRENERERERERERFQKVRKGAWWRGGGIAEGIWRGGGGGGKGQTKSFRRTSRSLAYTPPPHTRYLGRNSDKSVPWPS